MKIALLLAVSDYENYQQLPACRSDIGLMENILRATAQYDDILCISDDTSSTRVKTKIATWIQSHQGKPIAEIFFYYTGHGKFDKDEFYFPLSDYRENKQNQTALTNSEIDNWLRSLSPNLAIKVVDACNAGVTYLKDTNDALSKYLEKSGASFKKCYFMFSSRVDQASLQDNDLSFFTRSFAEAVQNYQGDLVRYKDIVDYISDSFQGNGDQTPFFITQAEFTEVFCQTTQVLRDSITTASEGGQEREEPKVSIDIYKPSLKETIEADARRYVTQEQIFGLLNDLQTKVQNQNWPQEVLEVYVPNLSFLEKPSGFEYSASIGVWIDKSDGTFFAKPTYVWEEYEAPEYGLSALSVIRNEPVQMVKKQRKVIGGYEVTTELPYYGIKLNLEANYPNIPWGACLISFVVSRTTIQYFYCWGEYEETDWKTRTLPSDMKWKTQGCDVVDKDQVFQIVSSVFDSSVQELITRIKAKFNFNESDER